MGDHVQPGGANPRSVWTISSEPFDGAHFATFPRELARRMILAGTPLYVCAMCGKPYKRQMEREFIPQEDVSLERGAFRGKLAAEKEGWRETPRGATVITSTGWNADCVCDAPSRNGVVCDPFGGAGTVGLVAQELNRDWVLGELSEEYIKIAEQRIANADPMSPTVTQTGDIQLSLFSESDSIRQQTGGRDER